MLILSCLSLSGCQKQSGTLPSPRDEKQIGHKAEKPDEVDREDHSQTAGQRAPEGETPASYVQTPSSNNDLTQPTLSPAEENKGPPTLRQKVPKDTAVLELTLPSEATVEIDGQNHGHQSRFTFSPLEPGQLYEYDLTVRSQDGQQTQRKLLLHGGWLARLPLIRPTARMPEVVLQCGHTSGVTSVAFSPDGRRILTGSVDNTAILWDTETGRQIRAFEGHTNSVGSVAFSPDGERILTGSGDGTAILWDTETGRKIRTFEGYTGWISSVAFSPDGRRILTGSWDRTAILLDTETGRQIWAFEGHTAFVTSVAFSPDGRRILTGSEDRTAILWDTETGRKIRVFEGHTNSVRSVAFSPDSRRILTGVQLDPLKNNRTILWDTETGRQIRAFGGHTSSVTSVAFSPDGRRILTGAGGEIFLVRDTETGRKKEVFGDKTAILWDTETGRKIRVFEGHTDAISSVAFSPDGRRILTGSGDRTAILWDTETGRQIRAFEGHTGAVRSVFSPDGRQILTRASASTFILWGTDTGRNIRTFEGHTQRISSVAISPDGRRVVDGLIQGNVRDRTAAILWDTETGRTIRAFEGHTSSVTSVAFSPDGRRILTGSHDRTAILWDTETGQKIRAFEGHTSSVTSVAFSPDGRRILTGSHDRTAILWDTETGQKIRAFEGHTSSVTSVAFSPDGRRILTGSHDRTAILWDTETGQQTWAFEGHTEFVTDVAFSPGSRRILTGSLDNTAILWDTESGRKIRAFEGHTSSATSVAFSPDGRRILTGSRDTTAILWDTETGRQIRTFEGHTSSVTSVAFSPDGRRILTAGDGSARLWDVAAGDELVRLISLEDGKDWLIVTPEGLFCGSEGGSQKVSFRIGGGLTVVPVERFFADFYRPGLLAEIWRGERPMPDPAVKLESPPRVEIVSPKESGETKDAQVQLTVHATDQGGGIRGPWLVHNGARVLTPGHAEQAGDTVHRRFEVMLVEGENRLEVQAASADGAWKSEPAILVLHYRRPLQKPQLHLLAVGINRYADGKLNLQFARPDAEALVDLFRQRGPALYKNVHSALLVDEQATKQAIRDTVRQIAEKARPQDTLVVFLAGHGSMVGQRYYFWPHSFQREKDRLEDDVRRQALPADLLGEELTAVLALKRVLIFDTCSSGGAVALASRGRSPYAFEGAITRLSRNQGIFTIAASAASEEAQEVKELGHGVLTYALLAGLRAVTDGPLVDQAIQPANNERVADVFEWFGLCRRSCPPADPQILWPCTGSRDPQHWPQFSHPARRPAVTDALNQNSATRVA